MTIGHKHILPVVVSLVVSGCVSESYRPMDLPSGKIRALVNPGVTWTVDGNSLIDGNHFKANDRFILRQRRNGSYMFITGANTGDIVGGDDGRWLTKGNIEHPLVVKPSGGSDYLCLESVTLNGDVDHWIKFEIEADDPTKLELRYGERNEGDPACEVADTHGGSAHAYN